MHFSMYVKSSVLDIVDHVFAASQGGAIPQEWIDAAGWEDVDRMEPPDEFWRTLVAGVTAGILQSTTRALARSRS